VVIGRDPTPEPRGCAVTRDEFLEGPAPDEAGALAKGGQRHQKAYRVKKNPVEPTLGAAGALAKPGRPEKNRVKKTRLNQRSPAPASIKTLRIKHAGSRRACGARWCAFFLPKVGNGRRCLRAGKRGR
jgi:ribonuclease BN (tRNA processing enzyme)